MTKKTPDKISFVPISSELLHRFSEPLRGAQRDESAVPSYLHKNPLVRWIITKRLQVIVSLVAKVLSKASGIQRPSALDLGCGIGLLIPSLSEHLSTFYMTDHAMDGARLAANHFGAANVRFVEPGAWPTVIPDQSLALIIAADVLEHVEDLEQMVATINQKLMPGGSLIVSGPTETFIYDICRKIASFSGDYHVRTIYDIERVIEREGFKAISCKKLPFPILPKLFRVISFKK